MFCCRIKILEQNKGDKPMEKKNRPPIIYGTDFSCGAIEAMDVLRLKRKSKAQP
jgi:hypothetical protein